jgi:hypothetical protein
MAVRCPRERRLTVAIVSQMTAAGERWADDASTTPIVPSLTLAEATRAGRIAVEHDPEPETV